MERVACLAANGNALYMPDMDVNEALNWHLYAPPKLARGTGLPTVKTMPLGGSLINMLAIITLHDMP